MYLYFDHNGTLLETINDKALRQYNKNINYAYVYIEDLDSTTNKLPAGLNQLAYWFELPTGERTKNIYEAGRSNIVCEMIPCSNKRDMQYFKDGVYYEMFKIRIPCGELICNDSSHTVHQTNCYEDNVFELAGNVSMTIQAKFTSNDVYTLGLVVFDIEDEVVKPSEGIALSQFDYLLKKVDSNIVKFDLEEEKNSLDYTLENLTVRTFTEPIGSAKIIVPSSVGFGFASEVNFKVWNDSDIDVVIENQSTRYALKVIQFGFEIGTTIKALKGQTVQLFASCDGLATVVYVNII